MRRFLVFISILFCLAAPVTAQDDDRGLITGFLEDNLSDAGRDVRIEGFEGALSSQATLDRLTIADDDGIWLELQNAELDWTRSALLTGRLEVDKLTAETIILRRLPGDNGPSPADTEARDFNLPDLPVSINIGTLRIDRVTLAAPVLGEAADFKLDGTMALDQGEGTAELAVTRLDKPSELTLDAGFDNTSRELNIDLALSEAKNGLLSRTIGLPGQPAIDVTLVGNGPLDDYSADLKLASDGMERFSGTIATKTETDTATRSFTADLAGDLRPLFQPDLRPFFGQETALELRATRTEDGALSISRFRAESAAMDLRGEAQLAAGGWPERIAVTGRLGTGASMTRLPLSGPPTQIEQARLTARYDKTQGEEWQAEVTVDRLENGPLMVDQAEFTAKGTLDSDAPRRFEADLIANLTGISHNDDALSRAIGSSAEAMANLSWREGHPLEILNLSANAGELTLTGAGQLRAGDDGLPLSTTLRLEAPALGRFAPLANLPLEGAATVTVIGNTDLLSGAFDGALFADTSDLGLGNPTLDPLIGGDGQLILSALRDENGIAIDQLDLITPEAVVRAIGRLSGQSGTLTLDATIKDLARTDLALEGPARLSTAIEWLKDSPLRLTNLSASVAQSTFSASGTLDPSDDSLPVSGTARIEARNLGQFSQLAGRPLRGAATLALEGQGRIKGQNFDLSLDGNAQNLRSSIASLDSLLVGGPIQFSGQIAKGDGPINLRALTLDTPGLTLRASGDAPGAPIDINARLANLARLAPGFSGPLTARGTVRILDDWARRMSLTLTANGPGGTRADISGTLGDYGASMDLQANGTAPLALANRFIEPRAIQGTARYDLRLSGAPSLAALSGQITTENARATLPTYGVVIEGITGRTNLTAGRANVSVTGRSRAGGRFQVDGPITLTPPFQGTLSISLDALRIVDPGLFATSASGQMTLAGPLATAPVLQGNLRLGETTIRVPSNSPVSTQVLEGVKHINDSQAARNTRAKAGLGAKREEKRATSLSLDLTINAPNRIFVRGRGLDAELGGQVTLRGSASDIAPSGQFRLIRGRFDILGKRLTLTEGLITLRGALDPYLRFVAETDAGDITARIIMEGLASAPEVRFTSTPELPQEEVISRLIFGRGLDKISGFQAAQLASAIATLRGGGPGILGTFRSELGLDDLDVTTTEDGATEVSAGSYISDNVYSEISADSEGRQQIELNLDVSRNVTIRGSASSDGNTGIGVFFEKDY